MGKFGKIGKISRGGASNNGGILGSGVSAMFGSHIFCKSTDDSMYCNIMKMFNVFIAIIMVCVILYFIYYFFSNYLLPKRGRSR